MTVKERQAIFISHANPESNEFTLWLGSRLSAAGYEVWADVLRLRGGHDWQRRLEDALRNKAYKVLLVGTETAVQKQGVRNEIQIATDTGRKIGDKDFIIPLRLERFDAPFLIAHAQYIDFQRSWGAGLAELLETLENEYQVPRTPNPHIDSIGHWKAAYQHAARSLVPEPESLVSNWLAVRTWAGSLRYYSFRNPIDHSRIRDVLSDVKCPLYPYGRGFLGFGAIEDYSEDLPAAFAVQVTDEIATKRFISDGHNEHAIDFQQARNIVTHLIRRGWDCLMAEKGLRAYAYSDRTSAWWFPHNLLPSDMVSFRWPDGSQGRRNLVGDHKGMHWHLALSARPWLGRDTHIRLIPRIVFTTDGITALDDTRQMHRLRRSVARNWRNDKWRDMLLASLFWLSEGNTPLVIPLGGARALELDVPFVRMQAPVSVAERGETGDDDLDPAAGDVVFEMGDDDLEDDEPDSPEEDGDA
jgi:hypothetical protein